MRNSAVAIGAVSFALISIGFGRTGEFIEDRKRRKQELRALNNIETKLERLMDDLNRGYPVKKKEVVNLSNDLSRKVLKFKKRK